MDGGGWKPHLARFMQRWVLIGEAAPGAPDRPLGGSGWGVFWGWRGVGLDSVPCLRGSRGAGSSSLPSLVVSFRFVVYGAVVDVASWCRNQATGSGNATEEERMAAQASGIDKRTVATEIGFPVCLSNGPPSANQWQCGVQC